MAETKKFLGCPYPINEHPLGYLRTQWGVNQIKSDLLALLLTNPGERVMLPSFGTPLKRLFFEPNDTIVIAEARQMIVNSINTWEPRVAITGLEVTTGVTDSATFEVPVEPQANLLSLQAESDLMESNDHVLSIRIKFVDPENISSIEELVVEVPMI